MAQIIKFTNFFGTNEIFPPEPAYKNIPDWYKDLESYIGGEKKPTGSGETTGTIKKCMPVFDAINSGYIIKSQVDVFVTQKEAEDQNGNFIGTMPWYEWANFGALSFHTVEQALTHPGRQDLPKWASYPKWVNPWSIETPSGYSCLFVAPFHRESIFTILPGVVDTDTYTAPVNFPFVLNDWKFEGLIPAGTPIVQVIPFKRDEFKMEFGNSQDVVEKQKVTQKLRTRFFDSYKNQFRSFKAYK